MMLKKSILLAATLAALTFAGNSAQAAFTITAVVTSPASPATGLTFTGNTISNVPVPTPAGGVGYNFVDITFAGGTPTVSPAVTFTVTGTLNVSNPTGAPTVAATFSQTFMYSVVAGFGTLTAVGPGTIVPTSVAGVNFGPILFASPTIADGAGSTGNLSTVVTAVPEPASVAMVGLGLASIGGLALRRRSAK